jgi:hypothetical protein
LNLLGFSVFGPGLSFDGITGACGAVLFFFFGGDLGSVGKLRTSFEVDGIAGSSTIDVDDDIDRRTGRSASSISTSGTFTTF